MKNAPTSGSGNTGKFEAAKKEVLDHIEFLLAEIKPDEMTGDRMAQISFNGPNGRTRVVLYLAGIEGMDLSSDVKLAYHAERMGFDPDVFEGIGVQGIPPYARVIIFVLQLDGSEEGRAMRFTKRDGADPVQHRRFVELPEDRAFIEGASTEETREQFAHDVEAWRLEAQMGLTVPELDDFEEILGALRQLSELVEKKRAENNDSPAE